jgi:hypothetical protein
MFVSYQRLDSGNRERNFGGISRPDCSDIGRFSEAMPEARLPDAQMDLWL